MGARRTGLKAAVALVIAALAATAPVPASADAEAREKPRRFWPLGEHKEVETLERHYVPFKGEGEIPGRPPLLIERGDRFLDTGNLHPGFEVPLTGAIWQPRLWSYLFFRTAIQSYDNGAPGTVRETEWANRLDWFTNLQLTGTEKILMGLRNIDNNRPDRFTRYTFAGADEGFNEEFNFGLETLFFEGDIGSMFPVLDPYGVRQIDYGITVGRQPITFQEGMLINDTVDAVGIIRNNILFRGTSNLRASAMWAWHRLDRNDFRGTDNDMFGLFLAADTPVSTLNLDTIYVHDSGRGDGLYLGASSIQRLRRLGGISSAFRVNSSFALEDEIPRNVVGTGALFSAEFSKTVPESDDIVYFNPFVSVGNYTQAGREAVVSGPLANMGILFAGTGLSLYGSELNSFTTNGVIGAALGYQAFWNDHKRNLVLEVGGRHDYEGGGAFDAVALGFQFQQAVGQHVQLQFDGFYAFNSNRDDGAGIRGEVLVNY